MDKIFTNEFISVLVQASISILSVLIPILVTMAVRFISFKKKEIVQKVGVENYNHLVSVAESVFYLVEQQFKGAPGQEKAKAFDEIISQRVPGLEEEDIKHFREAVVGKIKLTLKNECQSLKPPSVNDFPEVITVSTQAEPKKENE
jgi:hypothetical protein